jgi:uncharacterized protein
MSSGQQEPTEQTGRPVPNRTALDEHWQQALEQGRLLYQRCGTNAWLPPREEDPVSLSPDWEWAVASGNAHLVSWVTYHMAYHPYWEDKVPYQVAVVELAEGPRMIAPIELADTSPCIDLPLRVDIRSDGGQFIPVFVAEP